MDGCCGCRTRSNTMRGDMEEATPQPSPETAPTPARTPRQPAPEPIGLDGRGEALKALLPGPLADSEPEVDTALDEVVVTVPSERLLDAAPRCATTPPCRSTTCGASPLSTTKTGFRWCTTSGLASTVTS